MPVEYINAGKMASAKDKRILIMDAAILQFFNHNMGVSNVVL